MSNYNGVVYAERLAPTANNWLGAGYVDGRLKIMLDFYISLGTELSGSVLYMGAPLPVGAKILSVDVLVNASTANLTISVGDLGSATRYGTALTGPATGPSSTAALGLGLDATNGWYVIGTNPGTGPNAAITGDAQIILTTGGATLTIGQYYGVRVNYTTD